MCKWILDRTDLPLVIYLFLDKLLKNVTSTILKYRMYLLITHKPLTQLIEIKHWRA
jgi:hypothetical protein